MLRARSRTPPPNRPCRIAGNGSRWCAPKGPLMTDSKITELLARAAGGDSEAAAAFVRAQALRLHAAERHQRQRPGGRPADAPDSLLIPRAAPPSDAPSPASLVRAPLSVSLGGAACVPHPSSRPAQLPAPLDPVSALPRADGPWLSRFRSPCLAPCFVVCLCLVCRCVLRLLLCLFGSCAPRHLRLACRCRSACSLCSLLLSPSLLPSPAALPFRLPSSSLPAGFLLPVVRLWLFADVLSALGGLVEK